MRLNNGFEIPQIGVGTWTLRGETARQNVRLALQIREILALALDDMKAKAIEMGIEGVATASVLNSGDTVDWIGEMKGYISGK